MPRRDQTIEHYTNAWRRAQRLIPGGKRAFQHAVETGELRSAVLDIGGEKRRVFARADVDKWLNNILSQIGMSLEDLES